MNQQTLQSFILQLCALGERQFEQETKACALIESFLVQYRLPYTKERFTTYLPRVKEATLTLDGKAIPCAATSFISGTIDAPNHLISSLTSSQNFLTTKNINFNPLCKGISRSNHYFAPALAIPRSYVPRLYRAKKLLGKVTVKKEPHISEHILVGNTKNPTFLVFSHYDSISTGAIDNASGTALSLYLATRFPHLLKHTLFIFAANEELSYDKPIYWGHGYRVFEKKHPDLLNNAKKILILDCIGHSATHFVQNPGIVVLGFPIKNLQRIIKKVYLVIGDLQTQMTFYHSNLDTPKLIHIPELLKISKKINNMLA